jgi:predicted Zn-dependent peptidase
VVVAGNFDPKKISTLLQKQFGGVLSSKKTNKKKVLDMQTQPSVAVQFKESDQTHLIVGVRSFPVAHSSYYPLSVLAGILGSGMSSRLFQKVRTEMGLGYYVRASNDAFTDHGIFAASAGVVNERAKEAVSAIVAEFKKLSETPVSGEELKKTKDMIAGRLVLGLESSDELAEFYGFEEVLKRKLSTPEEIIKHIEKVTAKEVQAVAKKIFIEQHLNLALIGPWKDEAEFLPLLKF